MNSRQKWDREGLSKYIQNHFRGFNRALERLDEEYPQGIPCTREENPTNKDIKALALKAWLLAWGNSFIRMGFHLGLDLKWSNGSYMMFPEENKKLKED